MARTVWSRLAGLWTGEGAGYYPDIPPFRFIEKTTIELVPDWSMLCLLQRTWRDEGGVKGTQLHLENGIIQAREDGSLLYSCAQDSGRTEVMRGSVSLSGVSLRIDWSTIEHSFDERLVKMGRTWWFEDGEFRYEARLSTMRTPEYRKHLEASLRGSPRMTTF
jgi:hypothetical protein